MPLTQGGVFGCIAALTGALIPGMTTSGDEPVNHNRTVDRISRVVESINARAGVCAGVLMNEIGEDGSAGCTPDGSDRPTMAAWTVVNSGTDSGGSGWGTESECAIHVAVLGASSLAQVNDVVTKITGDPRIATITGIVTTAVTPTLAEMQAFDAVLVYTNSTPLSSVAMGDNLADYIDSGGGVVLTQFSMRASLATRTMEGRFLSANYYCVERSVGSSTTGAALLGTIHVPASPLLEGVLTFNGGTQSFRSPAGLHPMATRIADWTTGHILIAERTDLLGGRVDLNFFAVSDNGSPGSWIPTTDGAAMMRNALVVASRCGMTPSCVADVDDGSGTGNRDGGVTIEDLLYYLLLFERGDVAADIDDGSGTGNPDGGVTIDDLLYYIFRFESGC